MSLCEIRYFNFFLTLLLKVDIIIINVKSELYAFNIRSDAERTRI